MHLNFSFYFRVLYNKKEFDINTCNKMIKHIIQISTTVLVAFNINTVVSDEGNVFYYRSERGYYSLHVEDISWQNDVLAR